MFLIFSIGSFCLGFLVAFGLNWLALIPWRRSAGKHWTERACLLYPARVSERTNIWFIPVNVGILNAALHLEVNFFAAALFGFLGAILAGFFFDREIFPGLRFTLWLRLAVTGLFLFFLGWFVLVSAVLYMPKDFGWLTWLIAGGVFIFMLASSFGLGRQLLRWLGVLQPASESLNTLVTEVSEIMGVPVRATWTLSTYVCNAYALPLIGQLIFTNKLLETLSNEETKAICAHELGHLSESRKVRLLRGLAAFGFYPLIFTRPLSSFDVLGYASFLILFALCLFLRSIGRCVGRGMEKRADKIAAENQVDGAIYAHALERIYEANQMPAVMPRRRVHPDLYDRMIAAGVTPDFPKPLPPDKVGWTSYVIYSCIFIIPLLFLILRSRFRF